MAGRKSDIRKRRILFIYGILFLAIGITVIALILFFTNRTYEEFYVLRSEPEENQASSLYAGINGNILKCSTDEVRLQDRQGTEIWNISCSFSTPAMSSCENTIVVYDKGGTEILVADRIGKLGSFTASLPIVRACVSEDGNVAVIEENDNSSFIHYYSCDGTEIASIKTSMDDPGYPLDVSLSNDGERLAVASLAFKDGVQKGVVHVYSFGSAGQNQMDNRIAAFEFEQTVVPDVEFLDNKTFAAFRDNGFTVYQGTKVPAEINTYTTERTINGIFCSRDRIGLLETGENPDLRNVHIFNKDGTEIMDLETGFPAARAEINENEVSLYNGPSLCVYDLNGSLKFEGALETNPKAFFTVGKRRYAAVSENGFELLQLR
ncbi:MAG: hypothetical protein HUJ73_07910 [Eubacterium sp.]|nr:hypothetical protein [Eubacterium sp.]